MKKIMTIDAGTSNLRIRIIESNKVTFELKENYGVKIGKDKFQEKLYVLLKECMKKNNLKIEEIEIIASGMITSSLGLLEVEHIHVPVSLKKLAENIVKVKFFEFEINLIPGIKVEKEYFKNENIKSVDVIRGEEVEVFGILNQIDTIEPTLIILPGSHNKFIEVKDGEIINFLTTMSGEIYDAMTKHTILKNSVNETFADEIDRRFLLLGNEIGRRFNLNQGSFVLRGIDLVENFSINEKANYLLGLILNGDILSLEKNGYLEQYKKIIIAGGNVIAKGIFELLKELKLDIDIKMIIANDLSVKGALKIWSYNCKETK